MVERLWAPWRLAYVAAPKEWQTGETPQECFICQGVAAPLPQRRSRYVVYTSRRGAVILNRFPYNNGHLLICPIRHCGRLEDLTDEELLDLQHLLRQFMGIIQKRMNPDGFNIGLNLGRAAGAGLPGHLHWHLVPRWQGDTNFMPVIADTRVLVQSLEALYDVLTEELSAANQATPPTGPGPSP